MMFHYSGSPQEIAVYFKMRVLRRFPVRAETVSLLHSVRTESGAHWATYPVGSSGKRDCVPHTLSWSGAPLSPHILPTYEAEVAQSALYLGFGMDVRDIVVRFTVETIFLFCAVPKPFLKPTHPTGQCVRRYLASNKAAAGWPLTPV